MKIQVLILFLFLPFLAYTEENLQDLSFQAESYWEAHDYTDASSLYEHLLPRSLPAWQRARILYNLGTIRLSQHQPLEALNLFPNITPIDLSLPRFGLNLFLNLGIAHLQYAQTLASTSTFASPDQQALFVEQSLQAFSKAQRLFCQVQQMERNQETPAFSCQSSVLIDQWTQAAHLQLHAIHQQKRQNWIEQAKVETLTSFLRNHLQELIHRIQTLQDQDKQFSANRSLILYFQHQAESFLPIWNALQQKEFSPNQKTAFDQALTFYLKALQAFNPHDYSTALKELTQASETLAPLTFKENSALQQIYLNYEMIWLQESWTISDLQKLLTQLNLLNVEQNQVLSIEHIKENLRLSITELQAQHERQARFFLLAGLSELASFINPKESTSILILQQALEQAHRAMQLTLLAEFIGDESSKKTSIPTILKQQQQAILNQATLFIPTVLDEQQTRFQQARDSASSCQQSPWEQVIPLFDHGYQAAQYVAKQFSASDLNLQDICAKQKQTINDWQQALTLLLHPPQQNQKGSSSSESSSFSSNPKNLAETFRLIQEMYLQDQSQPEQETQELHSW
jgi:hypothetical protein